MTTRYLNDDSAGIILVGEIEIIQGQQHFSIQIGEIVQNFVYKEGEHVDVEEFLNDLRRKYIEHKTNKK